MQTIVAAYEAQHPSTKIKLNLAASSILAKQIQQRAPADLFLSASPEWMHFLSARSLADSTRVVTIARNQLIVITPAAAAARPAQLSDLLLHQYHPLALGDPSHVPVGIYACQVLQKAGLWVDLEPSLLPTLDASATLATVARGEAPAGIAYRTDVAARRDLRLAFAIPDSLQPDIRYVAALLRNSSQQNLAAAFLAFILSPVGQEILAQHQFSPPRANPD